MTKHTDQNTPRRALFFAGNKGGSGTTNAAGAVLHLLRASGRRVAAYDGDPSVGRLARLYGDRDDEGRVARQQNALTGVVPFDVLTPRGQELILNTSGQYAGSTDVDVLLFDLPSGTWTELGHIFGGRDDTAGVFSAFAEQGWRPVLVSVITPEREAIASVSDIETVFGDTVDHVVILNRRHGEDDEDFALWFGTQSLAGKPVGGKGRELIEQKQGRGMAAIADMPGLKQSTMMLSNIEGLAPPALITDRRVSVVDRSRAQRWLQAVEQGLKPALSLLGFSPASEQGQGADKGGKKEGKAA